MQKFAQTHFAAIFLAKRLVKNGCIAIGEGANMPTTPEGVKVFLVLYHL